MDMYGFRNEIHDLKIERNNAQIENTQLKSDLNHITQDAAQYMQCLKTLRLEVEELKMTLRDYSRKIESVGNEVSIRESEHFDLIRNLQCLNQKNSLLKTFKQNISNEFQSYTVRSTEAEKDIMKLEAYIQEKDCIIQSLERKVEEISSLRNQMEEQLHFKEKEKHGEAQELLDCHQTLQNFLMQREALSHQLTVSESCKDNIQKELEERETFTKLLENELASERQHSTNLENILHQTKTEFREIYLCNQRYQEDILGLSDKVVYLYERLGGERLENDRFQNNIEILREQITMARHKQIHSMKGELKQKQDILFSQTKNNSYTNFKRKVVVGSETKDIKGGIIKEKDQTLMEMRKNRVEYTRPLVTYKSCDASVQLKKQGERKCKSFNEKIKESDFRYRLYLEKLSKIQPCGKRNGKCIKKDTVHQCKQHILTNEKKNVENKKNSEDGVLRSNNQTTKLQAHCGLEYQNITAIYPDEMNYHKMYQENDVLESHPVVINRSENNFKVQGIPKEEKHFKENGKSDQTNSNDDVLGSELKTFTMEKFWKQVKEKKICANVIPNLMNENLCSETVQQNFNFRRQSTKINLRQPQIDLKRENKRSSDLKIIRHDDAGDQIIENESILTETEPMVKQSLVNENKNPTKGILQEIVCFKHETLANVDEYQKIEKITNEGYRKLQNKLERLKSQERKGHKYRSNRNNQTTRA